MLEYLLEKYKYLANRKSAGSIKQLDRMHRLIKLVKEVGYIKQNNI